jgi:hypothetical protein
MTSNEVISRVRDLYMMRELFDPNAISYATVPGTETMCMTIHEIPMNSGHPIVVGSPESGVIMIDTDRFDITIHIAQLRYNAKGTGEYVNHRIVFEKKKREMVIHRSGKWETLLAKAWDAVAFKSEEAIDDSEYFKTILENI